MESTGFGLIFKGAMIGFGLSILLLLIPIVHFITGPLGPLIGGYVGGGATRAAPHQALGIGILMGIFMATPVILVALALQSLEIWESAQGILMSAAGLLGVWAGVFGMVGAYFGGRARGNSRVIIIRRR